jgi:hypothetical protein
MTTKLERPLKREIEIDGKPYVTRTTAPHDRIIGKWKRKGQEISWEDILSRSDYIGGVRDITEPPEKKGAAVKRANTKRIKTSVVVVIEAFHASGGVVIGNKKRRAALAERRAPQQRNCFVHKATLLASPTSKGRAKRNAGRICWVWRAKKKPPTGLCRRLQCGMCDWDHRKGRIRRPRTAAHSKRSEDSPGVAHGQRLEASGS